MNTDLLLLFNNAFLVLGSFLSIILVVILVKNGKWKLLPNLLLCLYLLGVGSACIMSFLVTNKLI